MVGACSLARTAFPQRYGAIWESAEFAEPFLKQPRRPLGANAGVSNELRFLTNCISFPNSSTPLPLTLSGAHGLHVNNNTAVLDFRAFSAIHTTVKGTRPSPTTERRSS